MERKRLTGWSVSLLRRCGWILLFCMEIFPGAAVALEQYDLKIMTIQAARSSYVEDMAIADIINKHSTWLKASTLEGRASAYNLKQAVNDPILRKTALINLPQTVHWEALNQFPIFSGTGYDFSKIRYLFLNGVYFDAMISLNPKIKKFHDIVDKRVALGPLPTKDSMLSMFYDALGCECVLRKFMLFGSAHQALKDGRLDGIMTGGRLIGLPNHWVLSPFAKEIVENKDTFFISWDRNILEKKRKENGIPYYPAVIPVGVFRGQGKPWVVAVKYFSYAVTHEMPDRVVAEILRAVYANIETSTESMGDTGILSKNTMGRMGPDMQFYHPVALKFFEQHGMPTGDIIR